ncbi:hypothetical protein HK104_005049 [Borealophlyctis nickersoniae]|nr:hypothetical protein HK104_005049 [Borealophlyctis nickersoniae]
MITAVEPQVASAHPMETEDMEETTKSMTVNDLYRDDLPPSQPIFAHAQEEDEDDEEYEPSGDAEEDEDEDDEEKEDDAEMSEELNDILKESMEIQNEKVLRSGKSVSGTYRATTIMGDFGSQSDDEDDDDYQDAGSDEDEEEDMDDEEDDDDDEVETEEVHHIVTGSVSITPKHEKLLMNPGKVLRDGKEIQAAQTEEMGDLAARIKELMQPPQTSEVL